MLQKIAAKLYEDANVPKTITKCVVADIEKMNIRFAKQIIRKPFRLSEIKYLFGLEVPT